MNIKKPITFTILVVGLLAARADEPQTVDPAAPVPPVPAVPAVPSITIQTVELAEKKMQVKTVTWLGLAAEESSEALSSQLGLKPGEGLTVSLVAEGSPAEKAGFQKNDVLAELDGQLLVYPMQLRKLVQMHSPGDSIKIMYYRGGKKQTVSVKLGTTSWTEEPETGIPGALGLPQDLGELRGMGGQWPALSRSMANFAVDKTKMNLEIKRTMEQTSKALQDAVRGASSARNHALASVDRQLEALARDGVHVDDDATVIIRNKRNTTKTMVETDDSGSYILEAGARTHLTARDKNGKLLFDGDIDTAAERQSIPKEVWEKVAPMYEQITSPRGGQSRPRGKMRNV